MTRKRTTRGPAALADCPFCHTSQSVGMSRTCAVCLTTLPTANDEFKSRKGSPADSLVAKREILPSY